MASKIPVSVRFAREEDVPEIHRLLELYAGSGIVLRRSEENIRAYLGNFRVAEQEGKVCGCAAARDFGGNLFEIRSLVVEPSLQGHGIGAALVREIIGFMKRERSEWHLFTLTLQTGFFASLGFHEIDRFRIPEKIWLDCSKCLKRDRCDEIAMILDSGDAAAKGE